MQQSHFTRNATRAPGAPSNDQYHRREPENSVLHEVVRAHLPDALSLAAEHSEHSFGYPGFIENAFERYLECGLLYHGFVRVHCDGCGFDRLVAFSCKTRGLCPSCNTRRMHDTAAHLVDRVLPRIPYRQWAMSFPRYLRFQMARDPSLITKILRGYLQVVFAWQRRRARAIGVENPQCGAVTFIQRFGGFLNLNVHFHAVLPDGVFTMDDSERPRFRQLDPPTNEEISALTEKIIRRIAKILARHQEENRDEQIGDALAHVQAASVQTSLSAPRTANNNLQPERSAFMAGFSLHANVAVHENDREGIERLCRYGLRPAFALERLSWTDDGNIRYQYSGQPQTANAEFLAGPTDSLACGGLRRTPTCRHTPIQDWCVRSRMRPNTIVRIITISGRRSPGVQVDDTRGSARKPALFTYAPILMLPKSGFVLTCHA